MCNNDTNTTNCIGDILRKILILQKTDTECCSQTGCDKPFWGPLTTNICYNTRPISLYSCCDGTPWSFTYTIDGVESTSSVFRVESLDNNCCTCRIIYLDTETGSYLSTNEFFTINLDCVGAIRCLPDTYIDLC